MGIAIPIFTPFGPINIPVMTLTKPLEVAKTVAVETATRGTIAAAITIPFLSLAKVTAPVAMAPKVAAAAGGISGVSKIGLLAGGAAGGLLLSTLLNKGTPQTMTPTQTTGAAPQTTTQDQKATVKGGITTVRTDSPNITITKTFTDTYSTINQYGAGTIDSVTSPTVTPSVVGGDAISQLLAALQGQTAAQGQTLTPTQEATQTATSSDWITPLIIGGALLIGVYMLTSKKR